MIAGPVKKAPSADCARLTVGHHGDTEVADCRAQILIPVFRG